MGDNSAMETAPSPEERSRISRELRRRLLNVLPAATYQMDRFLSLVDITVDDSTETAAMECGPQPVMHLNREFVEALCQRDEHLMMLAMHEIYHLILGHTRLFPRTSLAHNIVFDAVINALLCQQFRNPLYTDFFTNLNSDKRFPGRLLRPPRGWPEKMEFSPKASENERKVMELLYGPRANTATYHEIMQLLEAELNDDNAAGGTLLGDHAGDNGDGASDPTGQEDPLIAGVLRKTTVNWPTASNPSTGRSELGHILDWLMPKPRSPRSEFIQALASLLRKASVLPASPQTPYTWKRQPSTLSSQTAVYDLHDRTVESRTLMYGETPVLFTTQLSRPRLRWTPRDITHIYLDVSGSMSEDLPWLIGALEPLYRRGLCRLYAFSTVVSELRRGDGFGKKLANTYGTDINCVFAHFLGFTRAKTPGKVVVLTDGYTGIPRPELIEEFKRRKVDLLVGVLANGYAGDLIVYAKLVEKLPALK
jgi:hypothetical protein